MLALAVCLDLSGCASTPYWVKVTEPLQALPPITVTASPWGPQIRGWVTRYPELGTCQPFIVEGSNYKCVLAHELKHCAGFDHPDYRYNLGCNAAAASLFPR